MGIFPDLNYIRHNDEQQRFSLGERRGGGKKGSVMLNLAI